MSKQKRIDAAPTEQSDHSGAHTGLTGLLHSNCPNEKPPTPGSSRADNRRRYRQSRRSSRLDLSLHQLPPRRIPPHNRKRSPTSGTEPSPRFLKSKTIPSTASTVKPEPSSPLSDNNNPRVSRSSGFLV
ncbi:hypothetical protein PAMA_002469 [Pampus argenteus]